MRFVPIAVSTAAALAGALLPMPLEPPAQAQTAGVSTATAVHGGHYIVDREHTAINLSVSSLYNGRMSDVSGILDLSTKDPGKTSLIVSVPVATLLSGNAMIDDMLKGADWLDAQRYPTVSFATTKIALAVADSASVTGDLTLHGMTRPVTFAVRLTGSGLDTLTKKHTARFEITGDISRSDFGMPALSAVFPDVVHLNIAGAFEQK